MALKTDHHYFVGESLNSVMEEVKKITQVVYSTCSESSKEREEADKLFMAIAHFRSYLDKRALYDCTDRLPGEEPDEFYYPQKEKDLAVCE